MDFTELLRLTEKKFSTRQIAVYKKCSQTRIRYWLNKFDLKTDPNRFPSKIDNELLLKTAAKSSNLSELVTELELTRSSANYQNLSKRLSRLGFDTKSFSGRRQLGKKLALESVFTTTDRVIEGRKLTKALLSISVPYCCSLCGINEWQGSLLVLPVDHKDGNRKNNNKENIRFLCPNCHSQTPTFCNKKRPLDCNGSESPLHGLREGSIPSGATILIA